MSNSVRPHRRQPTRLPRPGDSPGKNTVVGCHFPLQCMKVKSESEVSQLCPIRRDPMDCSLPGSSVHGIFQARVLEWGFPLLGKPFLLVQLEIAVIVLESYILNFLSEALSESFPLIKRINTPFFFFISFFCLSPPDLFCFFSPFLYLTKSDSITLTTCVLPIAKTP